jgi:hypothetical protein
MVYMSNRRNVLRIAHNDCMEVVMIQKKKIMLWFLLAIALLSAAFFFGGFVGFGQGYAYCVYHRSILDAHFTLNAIESVTAGEIKTAKEQLERQLDGHIIEHYTGLNSKPWISFNTFQQEKTAIRNIMSRVTAYREKHPSETSDQAVKSAIDMIINQYQDQ